jgi:TonB family protein
MGRAIRYLAGFLLAAAPAAAVAQTLPLHPGAEWQHTTEDGRCRAARVFGEGAGRNILILEQIVPDDRINLTFAGPAFDRIADTGRMQVTLGGDASRSWVSAFRAAVPGFGSGLVMSGVRVGEAAARSALPELRFDAGQPQAVVTLAQRGRTIRLDTGALDGVFAALNTCTQRLAATAGLEVDRLRAASAAPQWQNRSAIRGAIGDSFQEFWKHYERPQGIVHLRVTVNEDGEAEDCRTIPATGDVAPNQSACRIMQQARFTPARDAEGQPLRAFYTTTFRDYRHARSDGFWPGGE